MSSRCRAISRAIAAPDGAIPPAELSAHLAACPRCSAFAEQASRLDRAWEATRPALPTPAAWDAAWAAIEHPRAADPADVGPSRTAIRAVVGLALAAAALLLIGLGVARLAPPGGPEAPRLAGPEGLSKPSPPSRFAGPIRGELSVEVGLTVLYSVDRGETTVIQANEPGLVGDEYFALYGLAESMPEIMASHDSPTGFFTPLAQ